MTNKHILHAKSNVVENGQPSSPSANRIEYGELAVNYSEGKETIFLKNDNDEIVSFSNDTFFQSQIDTLRNDISIVSGFCTVIFTSSDGVLDFTGKKLTIEYLATKTMELTIPSTGRVTFGGTRGMAFTLKYPVISGYTTPEDESYTFNGTPVIVTKNYVATQALTDRATGVVLEYTSNPAWPRVGRTESVDEILAQYGSYVIDESRKTYAQLNPQNHEYFADNTPYSGSFGNCFRRLPRVYYLVTDGENTYSSNKVLYVSLLPISDKYWEEDWIGTYKGALVSGALVSRPGLQSTQNATMQTFWNNAQKTGENYGLVDYFDHCKLVALHLCKFGTTNSDTTMGIGLAESQSTSYYSNVTTGYTKTLGDGTGNMAYGTTQYKMNKLFGIEGLAGAQWEFRPNIYFEGVNAFVYEGNRIQFTAPYVRTFQRDTAMNLSQSYITKMRLGDYCDFIPITGGGSSVTWWCDGAWSSSAGQLLLVGGYSVDGSLAGLSSATSYDASSRSDAHIGGRLAFKGDIDNYTLITGAEMVQMQT